MMKLIREVGSGLKLFRGGSLVVALSALCQSSWSLNLHAEPNVVLWDTSSAVSDAARIDDRTGWRIVPNDLLSLEADPPKASSDPGYYGREYVFRGDAVVENQRLVALFWAAQGRIVVYAKTQSASMGNPAASNAPAITKVFELVPLDYKTKPAVLDHLEILRNAQDEVALQVFFKGSPDRSVALGFGRSEIVDVKPSAAMRGMSISGAFEYGVVPSFVGDDLIFGTEFPSSSNSLCLPAESVFLGLLKGEASELVMTWPKGKQGIRLALTDEPSGRRSIASIDFDNDGQGFYLATLTTPGIWHKEALSSAYLEKDVASSWKRPFPARWKTQLFEESLKTTFAFRESKGEIWRGVPGSYSYPVWFDDDHAVYHLSKKVPPKGESLIYFLEGQGTPSAITSPVDILKGTLGRPMADAILDLPGRKLRTHHRRGGEGVHRACTCGCTEAIQAVFEAGEEVSRKDDIKGDLEDMVYFVHQHVDRINQYQRFADDLIQFLQATKSSAPDLGEYINTLDQIVRQIPQEYTVQQENMKTFAYADDLVRRTLALTAKQEPGNLTNYMALLKDWRAMGGAQDYVLAQCHTITRKLAQEAGYGCVNQFKAVALAREIRARARQCLRNPDGYEIWAEY